MQKVSERRIFMAHAVVVLEYFVSRNPGVSVTLTTGPSSDVEASAPRRCAPNKQGQSVSTENTS